MASHSSSTQDDDQPIVSSDDGLNAADSQTAIEMIRGKVDRLYRNEPDASDEVVEAEQSQHRSKHQQFMYDLSTSGKDLAAIQTEWHNYYQSLSAQEKHQVWQEFYDSQSQLVKPTRQKSRSEEIQTLAQSKKPAPRPPHKPPKLRDVRSAHEVQSVIRHNVTAGGKLQAKHQLQSLLFGLGIGLIFIFIFMFGFFNEAFIAPFFQPSRAQANTPLIVSSTSVAPTSNPEVIIPKINVEIPVDYTETSINESVIENDLQGGVVHYPTTVLPGQDGNTAYFGHSSNNIFNPGRYKFAFVLLHTLVNGDTFYLTSNGKIYVYKVVSHAIVSPSDVGVLGPVAGQTATATLITCDPPGTSINRLVVVGQQISPDPSGNAQAAPVTSTTTLPTQLPGNGQTLW
ncbi:MAG TPA: class E sortase, partial [Candidatus Dormibacteraeota bacterium]|nr:class E sortase [Candidatus Dormibacteraeota bacterium]